MHVLHLHLLGTRFVYHTNNLTMSYHDAGCRCILDVGVRLANRKLQNWLLGAQNFRWRHLITHMFGPRLGLRPIANLSWKKNSVKHLIAMKKEWRDPAQNDLFGLLWQSYMCGNSCIFFDPGCLEFQPSHFPSDSPAFCSSLIQLGQMKCAKDRQTPKQWRQTSKQGTFVENAHKDFEKGKIYGDIAAMTARPKSLWVGASDQAYCWPGGPCTQLHSQDSELVASVAFRPQRCRPSNGRGCMNPCGTGNMNEHDLQGTRDEVELSWVDVSW